jgi:hypothetical protein
MADRPAPLNSAQWIEDEDTVRQRWQHLVTTRRVLIQS